MTMTREEFIEQVAELVAGLQVPVSMMPKQMFGAAYDPWSKLLTEVTGFGWTTPAACREAFAEIMNVSLGEDV
jgi:hypothetical protein